MYDLPLWRLLRQIKALYAWRQSSLRDVSLAVRAAVNATAGDFDRYIGNLTAATPHSLSTHRVLMPSDMKRYGVAYKKGVVDG